jgi:hypothetical protein
VQRIEQQARKKGEAPAVSTARVDVDPGTGSKRSVMESLVETPMSRRTMLKTAGSQAMQSMLPVGDIAKALDVPVPTGALSQATQAAPVIPVVTEAMIPGLVAEGLQMGLSFPRVMKMVQGELGTGLKNLGEADIERMYYNLFDPYSATNIPGTTRAGDAWRAMTGVEGAFGFPFTQLRQSMRSVRKADPELYETLKKLSRDIAEYGPE